jgi:hypothetical protein
MVFMVALGLGLGSTSVTQGQEGAPSIQGQLQGTWKSVCMKLDSGGSMVMTSTYSGAGSSQDKVVFYTDGACAAPSGLVKSNPSVSYTIGTPSTLGDKKVYPIDTTIQSWQLTQNGSVIRSGGAVPTQYDIFAIEGNKLYTSGLTRSHKGPITNPAERPSTLDTTNYFVKQ